MRLRHILCGAMAQCLMKTSRARRAARRALSGEVVTPIYFHKPNKKLFAQCIEWLLANGYTLLTLDELIDILEKKRPIPKGAAWISLDDGYREWLSDVLPLVQHFRIPVTLFIPSGIIAGDGRFPWMTGPEDRAGNGQSSSAPSRMALTLDELKIAARYPGVQIQAHSVTHRLMPNCADAELRFEIGASKRDLEHWLDTPVTCFSYPEGRYDGRERDPLRDFGFRMAATTEPRFIDRNTDPMLVPRFCVPDEVTFAEAVCNMIGIWRPFLDPIKTVLTGRRAITGPSQPGPETGRAAGRA
ncbi:MAG TPA: polysaccharide deacetylase family protein [Terriglobia bacterium]|nr:polysaccharide deacetylase family protein [Terriglobia bacterium]